MNRKNFIRSLCILSIAPSLICEVDNESDIILLDKLPKPLHIHKQKIANHFKASKEVFEDDEFMDWFLSKNSDFIKDLYKSGFDFSKPYNIQIGWENDDFTRNLKTCIISQYI